jgi:small subunit ribosomal protein S9
MSNLFKLARILPATAAVSRAAVSRPLALATQQRFATTFQHSQQQHQQQHQQNDILQYREKPESLSYFTGNFKYNDLLIELNALYKRFEDWKPVSDVQDVHVPSDLLVSSTDSVDKVYSWKLRDKMSELLSIPLTTSQWRKITTHLNALAALPKPLPASVANILEPYQRFDSAHQNNGEIKTRTLDDMGRAYAVGRRKESSARCYLVEGEGKVLVNGMELDNYFQRSIDRNEVTMPLDVTESKDKFNAWIVVKGGGTTGKYIYIYILDYLIE